MRLQKKFMYENRLLEIFPFFVSIPFQFANDSIFQFDWKQNNYWTFFVETIVCVKAGNYSINVGDASNTHRLTNQTINTSSSSNNSNSNSNSNNNIHKLFLLYFLSCLSTTVWDWSHLICPKTCLTFCANNFFWKTNNLSNIFEAQMH